MDQWQECPVEYDQAATYYCRLLGAERKRQEEEICGICHQFSIACKKNRELLETLDFVDRAHHGQVRKGTTIPYLIHLLRTWHYVQMMTGDIQDQQAALLHDVLEDTSVTASGLQTCFGETIFHLVAGESEDKREKKPAGETWQIRKQETIDRLRGRLGEPKAHSAMLIALGDKLANLFSMWYEYRLVGDVLWQKFNQKDKTMHAWYYGEMGVIFSEYFAGGEMMKFVQEYKKYYREIFE